MSNGLKDKILINIRLIFYMHTKPLNEQCLWKGEIQKANYPKPVCKPDMVGFTKINSLTGTIMRGQEPLDKELTKKFEFESYLYWLGVEERKRLYRGR